MAEPTMTARRAQGRTRRRRTLWVLVATAALALSFVETSAGAATPPGASASTARWRSVQSDWLHTCGIRMNHTLWCWGSALHGELGIGRHATEQTRPAQVGASQNWKQVSLGTLSTCATRLDGTLWCWGSNDWGELGIPGLEEAWVPRRVTRLSTWRSVTHGGYHACALQVDQSMWCWGRNNSGQVGDGTTDRRDVPTLVAGEHRWRQMTAGNWHTCAIDVDSALWCWGWGRDGELGYGGESDMVLPTQVTTPEVSWRQVQAGTYHTCGLDDTGLAYCWGDNQTGQVGDGSGRKHVPRPAQVASDETWDTIAPGGFDTCGVTTAGALFCWGWNNYGQLGDGTHITRQVPERIGDLTTWATSSGEGYSTCSTQTDGSAWCTGLNDSGQLGDGTRKNRRVPTRVL